MAHGAIENYCDLPYAAEYARSNRSTCKKCKGKIGDGALRMSAREPSRFFDGVQDNWHHVDCFFAAIGYGGEKINEKSIRGIEVLRWDDQERIRQKIAETEKGTPIVGDFECYKAEYSKTNKGKCKRADCKKNFAAGELKIGMKGGWYHHGCALRTEDDEKLQGEPDEIQGFVELKDEDKKFLRDTYGKKQDEEEEVKPEAQAEENIDAPSGSGMNDPAPNLEDAPPKKKYRFGVPTIKKDPKEIHREAMKNQTDIMWEMRSGLEKLNRYQMKALLEASDMICPESEKDMLEMLVDCATFGKPLRCPKCTNGEVIFSLSARTYTCLGHLSEYTKCPYSSKNPVRSTFTIPASLGNELSFLCNLRLNVLTNRTYPLFEEEEEVVDRSAHNAFRYLGARQMKNVGEAYVDGKKERKSTTGQRIIKSGTVVDAESQYAQQSHVERDDDGSLFSVELSKSDLISNINSYYRMQLLKDDIQDRWYLFRSWGRVGTDIGSVQDDSFHHKEAATHCFRRHFFDKTGNKWEEKDYFLKKAGHFDMIETDYSDLLNNSDLGKVVDAGSQTTLPKSVKEIVMMISDVEAMKASLNKFHLDTTKMPLGKLSKTQLSNAYSVLSELQNMIESQDAPIERIYDCTNRFYTLVPHDFGMNKADVLDNLQIIKEKCSMIDALMDFQMAFKVANKGKDLYWSRDPVDVNYENLKCLMDHVDPRTDEYKYVEKYFLSTHGRTHGHFKIKITDVLRLTREGEDEKFTWHIGNRKLLWHGSRTTNFMGILSQGLRIAPPEAPVSGYMFGKGVYFADMVSKSAQYCRNEQHAKSGLLLLCDVALGEMQEEVRAVNIQKPKKGYSSVKGVGRHFPTDTEKCVDPSGWEFNYGKTAYVPNPQDFSLDYNEYIVYNTNQIRMRYLVRFSFGR